MLKKSAFVLVSLFALSLGAQAEEQVMTDPASAQLAKALAGHVLLCGPVDADAAKTEDKGFFPLTIKATDQGAGKTLLSVTTKDPEVGFGYGGDEFDATEATASWFILSNGDDGRRHLFLQSFNDADAKSPDYACDPKSGDDIDGQLSGIVSEIWDAGTISSRGVQCCFR